MLPSRPMMANRELNPPWKHTATSKPIAIYLIVSRRTRNSMNSETCLPGIRISIPSLVWPSCRGTGILLARLGTRRHVNRPPRRNLFLRNQLQLSVDYVKETDRLDVGCDSGSSTFTVANVAPSLSFSFVNQDSGQSVASCVVQIVQPISYRVITLYHNATLAPQGILMMRRKSSPGN